MGGGRSRGEVRSSYFLAGEKRLFIVNSSLSNETKRILKRNEEEERIAREEDFGDTLLGQLRTSLWYLTEYPERTKAAKVRT